MATEAFEEIADTFEFLDEWEDRYRHVIDMGKAMAPLDDAFKVPRRRSTAAPARSGSCRGSRARGRAHGSISRATATRSSCAG
jgi:hypothetical protein